MTAPLSLLPLANFPLVEPGDDLASLIVRALRDNEQSVSEGDVLVLAQKIVSKSEGRYVRLADIEPGPEALALAAEADKDPRLVQVILSESREVVRVRPGVIIVEHRNGYVLANAGIDRSNIHSPDTDPQVLLLPEDADRSAGQLRAALSEQLGIDLPVLINDSVGRAWRNGTVGMAIGCSGLKPLNNQIGETDLFDNLLEVTEPAVADELAAAASLVMGQAAEGCPVVLVRGFGFAAEGYDSRPLLRDRAMDMFR